MKRIAFAPWGPDRAPFDSGYAPEAAGVLPSASGYVPFPSLQADTVAALPAVFRGGISLYDIENTPVTIAGTDTGLYKLDSGAWKQIGKNYTGNGNRWDFARYGNTMIAVNGVNTPQYATLGSGTLSDFKDISGAPVASSVEIVREFVILGGVDRTKIRWSAIGNPLDWPVPGSNDAQYKQADEQDFPDTGSTVAVAGALNGMDVIVFTERAIHRGQYTGTPFIFQFDILDKGRGTIAPASVVTGSNAVYFLSEEGFFATDGGTLKNIGFELVNNWFRKMSEDTRRHEMRGGVDPVTGIIVWSFASEDAPANVHDYLIAYHPGLDRWSYGKADTTGVFTCLSQGKTLEDLDAVAMLDKLKMSLDSKVWKGGVPGLAAFLPNHMLAWFAGDPMEAMIDTQESGGERMMIHGVRPLVDGSPAEVTILKRDFLHQQPQDIVCAPASAFDGVAYTHISTRYARARIRIPEGSGQWAFALGCDLTVEEEGTI